MVEKGGISVETKHIFPIIKKWLYSDKDIFLRELVSNACDAVTKLKRLVSLGEIREEDLDCSIDELKIKILLNKSDSTLTITDNGIGMTSEEIKKYVNQIALSGALDFIEKYETVESENADEGAQNGIIGHFGLGFYSAFMVADKVDIKTKSYTGAAGAYWTCVEAGEFELSELPEKTNRGTDVILYINEENSQYLETANIKRMLDKYCAFMPVEIYFEDAEPCSHEHDDEEDCECGKPINDIIPLWTKNPSDCTAEEYKEFYTKLFNDYKEPLFYIHIKADYPLNFKGILYFPKINHQFDGLEGEIKLYYNQVFVADNIKEVVPEYLFMLKGVLDCPELPLNVSRSYLQNLGYVNKISAHIVKKVGDKLTALFNNEREQYEAIWPDLKTFIEYGCLRDRKFFDRFKDIIIFKTVSGGFVTVSEYLEKNGGADSVIYYSNDPAVQATYINMYKRSGKEVVILDNMIETQFITLVEMQDGGDKQKISFVRVDSELVASEEKNASAEDVGGLDVLFKEAAGKELKVELKELQDEKIPALLTITEQSRRMADMMRQYRAIDENIPVPMEYEASLILNLNNGLIKKLRSEEGDSSKRKAIAKQIYMIALLNTRQLSAEELESFTYDSFALLDDITI